MKTLEEVSIHYQNTGETLPEYYEHLNDYILHNIQDIYDNYIKNFSIENKTEFSLHFYDAIHKWDIDHGFFKEYSMRDLEELGLLKDDECDTIDFEAFFGDDDDD